MTLRRMNLFSWSVALLLCGATWASAQTTATTAAPAPEPFQPTVGQQGKDVVWVPTTEAMVEKMLDHANVTAQDVVMDLGSGDGRMIIAAAKRGARATGVEFNPDMVELSKKSAAAAGVAEKATFIQGDMYEADISKATVLALFLLPHNLEKLVPKFLELPAGSRIVANTYWVTGWTPDDEQTLPDGCDSWCTSKLFIIPAKVQGKWSLPNGTLTLTQQYQMVEGTFTPAEGGGTEPVKGRLRGNAFTLAVAGMEYEGSVKGKTIEGSQKGVPGAPLLVATRVE